MAILQEILSFIPDYKEPWIIEEWAEGVAKELLDANIGQQQRDSFVVVPAADIDPLDARMRQQFINAVLLADWAAYQAVEDRVEYERLRNVICEFPQGFRVWFCLMSNGAYMPVAYTGWFPISEGLFDKAHDNPQNVKHRKEFFPKNTLSANGGYIWIFNYSIIKPLRKSDQSRLMLKTYAADINNAKPRGLIAAVISEESKSVARKFGMSHVGKMTHMGVSEEVWAVRYTSSHANASTDRMSG
ncbi:MAG: hypothetical protein PHX43_01885 [Alphaproteobacteria bacterium]|nr:hypothetical protein [Alphaproteobacteria bacterium]